MLWCKPVLWSMSFQGYCQHSAGNKANSFARIKSHRVAANMAGKDNILVWKHKVFWGEPKISDIKVAFWHGLSQYGGISDPWTFLKQRPIQQRLVLSKRLPDESSWKVHFVWRRPLIVLHKPKYSYFWINALIKLLVFWKHPEKRISLPKLGGWGPTDYLGNARK